MKVSIIIVSWNTQKLLQKCLESVFEYIKGINFEVIVVDNNSTDSTKNYLVGVDRDRPNISVILNNKNLGFAKANNQGIKKANGDYILLLNPDTELKNNSIKELADFMNGDPKCSIAGPKLLNTDDSLQHSVRRFPKLLDQALILLKLHNLFPNLPTLKKYFFPSSIFQLQTSNFQSVDQVMGAAFMIRKSVIEKVGVLDDEYKRNFEEVDFCYRVKKSGGDIYYIPKIEIFHHKGASFKQVGLIKKQSYWNHDVLRFFKKHRPVWQYFILWLLTWPALLGASIVQVILKLNLNSIKKLKKKEL